MRPAKVDQSAFRAPLNRILGTEANVRVLRALSLSEVSLSRSEIARRSGLSLPGVAGALAKLLDAGIVETHGPASRPTLCLRKEHPLHGVLLVLFRREAGRMPALLDDLRTLMGGIEPAPRAAWLEGPVAEGIDQGSEPLVLGFLAGARDVSAVAVSLREGVARIECEYDVTIEVRGRTEADLATVGTEEERLLRAARGLVGPHPTAYLYPAGEARTRKASRVASSHAVYDERALLAGDWIAKRLDHDPGLPKRARTWLVHRLHEASEQEAHELGEWLRLLDTASIPRLQYVLRDAGERSTRLRQSNPFLPVLTDAERSALREEVGR